MQNDSNNVMTSLYNKYSITEKDIIHTTKHYFNDDRTLKQYPAKAKRKIIVLTQVISRFTKDRSYTEKEVNEIIEKVYVDFVTIRRDLIDYGFLDRKNDGSSYWLGS